MKKIFACLLVITALGFTACKKGENGTDGAKGEKGDKGEVGAQGAKGADGSVMHGGNGAPATTLGNVGDYYLDKSASTLYGPKTATGWPTPISLKGDAGATGASGAAGTVGAAGTKIYSGTAAPALSLGAVGDFYFDTVNLAFYGPKTASSWGNAISLKAGNSVTTFLYSNQNLDNVVLENSHVGKDQSGNPLTTYLYTASKTIDITHPSYADAYQTGLVMVRFKFAGDQDGHWAHYIYKEIFPYNNGRGTSIYVGNDEDDFARSKKVIIPADYSTTEDPNGDLFKNQKLDIKIVCIPAGTVIQMNSKNVDTKNADAVAKYLNL